MCSVCVSGVKKGRELLKILTPLLCMYMCVQVDCRCLSSGLCGVEDEGGCLGPTQISRRAFETEGGLRCLQYAVYSM